MTTLIKEYIEINIDWLGTDVHVFFVEDVAQFRNVELIEAFPELPTMNYDTAGALHTYVDEYPNDHFVILRTTADLGIIAHECYHCAKAILENSDIENEEATAYMLEHLVRKINLKLEKL